MNKYAEPFRALEAPFRTLEEVEECTENQIIFVRSAPVELERSRTMPRLPLPQESTQVGAHNHTLTFIYFSHVLNEKIDRNFSLKPTQYNFNKIFQ